MDNLAHSLAGAAMAQAGLGGKYGKGATLALILGSSLPDLDILTYAIIGEDAFLWRRMWTHNIFALPILSAGAAWIFSRIYKHIDWKQFFGLFLLASTVHMAMDLLNSYGVVALFPLHTHRFELAWVFIIDLAFWGILLLPLAFRWWKVGWMPAQRAARWSLIALTIYTGLCGAGRFWSSSLLAKEASGSDFQYVFHEPFGPLNWRGVIKRGSAYDVYLIRLPSGEVEYRRSVPTNEEHPEVMKMRATEYGQDLDWFFKAPVWGWDGEGNVFVYDLRFVSEVIERPAVPFKRMLPVPGWEPPDLPEHDHHDH